MLTIIIPMAGHGSRFSVAGYKKPKPLIDVRGQPMIQRVIQNLTPSRPHRFVFICQARHLAEYGLEQKLSLWAPGCAVVATEGVTEGAACTVLLARDYIDAGPLMIANSDQYLDIDIDIYLAAGDAASDGLIMTMTANDPKWSFVARDVSGWVSRVVEKEVISDEATVGVYNFSRGEDFVRAAEEMIARDLRVNGEFYVAPAYNLMIEKGGRIGVFNVGLVGETMHGLGTPSDLDAFLALGEGVVK